MFIIAFIFYNKIYGPNIQVNSGADTYLYVPDSSDYKELLINLEKNHLVKRIQDFEWAASVLHFGKVIKAGKYRLHDGMSNKQLIRKIQLGDQEQVMLVLHNLRLKENLAGYVSHKLEADSLSILALLNDPNFVSSYGYTPENSYTMILPNTYSFKWNTTAKDFIKRMYNESEHFWTPARLDMANEAGISKIQAVILASIVNQESNRIDEMPIIAGVYLNRLHKGIKLDADPTVIFANNDFTIRRVTRKYLIKDSPYNTYMYAGLPPGPITMPSMQAIKAVLHYQKSDYLFFCAKDDFSGHHAFAVTHAEHIINAHKFQKALDERNIH